MIPELTLALAALVAAPVNEPGDARLAEFDAFLQAFRQEQRMPSLSVAVVEDGQVIFAEGYGFQDHDAEEPTTPETTYLVASITKTFTGATLLGMAADGLIDLDADFTALSDWDRRCEWLGESGIIFGGATLDDGTVIEPVGCDGPISLRQVLTHRVNGEPGTDFLYNPVVFGRLSNFVEEQTGRPFREFVYEYVIEPGRLDHTAAGWRDQGKGHVLTQLAPPFGHNDNGRVEPSALPNPELNASSGIISSALDLARYAIALQEGRILAPALRDTMWTPPQKPSGEAEPYAYGWYVQDWQGHRLVFHTGWWPDAYTGLLLIAPDDGTALVALGNTDGLHWDKRLDQAGVGQSMIAAKFLQLFLAPRPAADSP